MSFTKIITDGFRGFAVFFSIILVIKSLLFTIDVTNTFSIEVMDVYHSSLGLVLFILNTYSRNLLKD